MANLICRQGVACIHVYVNRIWELHLLQSRTDVCMAATTLILKILHMVIALYSVPCTPRTQSYCMYVHAHAHTVRALMSQVTSSNGHPRVPSSCMCPCMHTHTHTTNQWKLHSILSWAQVRIGGGCSKQMQLA